MSNDDPNSLEACRYFLYLYQGRPAGGASRRPRPAGAAAGQDPELTVQLGWHEYESRTSNVRASCGEPRMHGRGIRRWVVRHAYMSRKPCAAPNLSC